MGLSPIFLSESVDYFSPAFSLDICDALLPFPPAGAKKEIKR